MSDFITIKVDGLAEKQQALAAFGTQLNDATAQGLREGMQPIREAMYTYPPQRGFMGAPTTRTVHLYERTNNYRDSISQVNIYEEAGGVVGEIESGAPYSIYLRGTPDGEYGGAWMHVGWWEPLFSIIRNRLSVISARINVYVDALIERLGLA